jgi:hypothetical protein
LFQLKGYEVKLAYFLCLLSFFSFHALGNETLSISEKSLLGLSLETSPQWESIEAAFLASKSEAMQLKDSTGQTVWSSLDI